MLRFLQNVKMCRMSIVLNASILFLFSVSTAIQKVLSASSSSSSSSQEETPTTNDTTDPKKDPSWYRNVPGHLLRYFRKFDVPAKNLIYLPAASFFRHEMLKMDANWFARHTRKEQQFEGVAARFEFNSYANSKMCYTDLNAWYRKAHTMKSESSDSSTNSFDTNNFIDVYNNPEKKNVSERASDPNAFFSESIILQLKTEDPNSSESEKQNTRLQNEKKLSHFFAECRNVWLGNVIQAEPNSYSFETAFQNPSGRTELMMPNTDLFFCLPLACHVGEDRSYHSMIRKTVIPLLLNFQFLISLGEVLLNVYLELQGPDDGESGSQGVESDKIETLFEDTNTRPFRTRLIEEVLAQFLDLKWEKEVRGAVDAPHAESKTWRENSKIKNTNERLIKATSYSILNGAMQCLTYGKLGNRNFGKEEEKLTKVMFGDGKLKWEPSKRNVFCKPDVFQGISDYMRVETDNFEFSKNDISVEADLQTEVEIKNAARIILEKIVIGRPSLIEDCADASEDSSCIAARHPDTSRPVAFKEKSTMHLKLDQAADGFILGYYEEELRSLFPGKLFGYLGFFDADAAASKYGNFCTHESKTVLPNDYAMFKGFSTRRKMDEQNVLYDGACNLSLYEEHKMDVYSRESEGTFIENYFGTHKNLKENNNEENYCALSSRYAMVAGDWRLK